MGKTAPDVCAFVGLQAAIRTPEPDAFAAGVDEGTIMALCGWRTRAMFDG